jgi:hypothetical protein
MKPLIAWKKIAESKINEINEWFNCLFNFNVLISNCRLQTTKKWMKIVGSVFVVHYQ